MITRLALKNFKCHSNTDIQISALTLLSGQNSIGKSSILQSLLLLKQTYEKSRLDEILDLNRPLCYIGTAKDVLYQKAKDKLIIFIIYEKNKTYKWSFQVDDYESSFLEVDKKETNIKLGNFILDNWFLAKPFHFLGASRFNSPYAYDDFAVERNQELSLERGQAELTAQFLFHYQKKHVLPELCHPNSEGNTLLHQVIAWEREISQGVNVHPEKIGNGYTITYSFDMPDGDRTEQFSSENVGFGLSYVLPILVAILSSAPNTLILIENPEAHLHPYGQAKLTELMALAAAHDIQIIAETHSDHIVNGALVAVKQHRIAADKVKIYHLDRNPEEPYAAQAIEINVAPDGKIDKQPHGFFDQIEKDMEEIMGF